LFPFSERFWPEIAEGYAVNIVVTLIVFEIFP
jgi:hypothetical protein